MLTTAGAPLSGPLRGRGGTDAGLLHTVVSEPGAAAVTRGHRELPTVHRHSCENLDGGDPVIPVTPYIKPHVSKPGSCSRRRWRGGYGCRKRPELQEPVARMMGVQGGTCLHLENRPKGAWLWKTGVGAAVNWEPETEGSTLGGPQGRLQGPAPQHQSGGGEGGPLRRRGLPP